MGAQLHVMMSNRRTTFMFDGQESELLNIAAGILQGSPISPILFLFYNSELLDICNPHDIRVHGLGFVDDVNHRVGKNYPWKLQQS